MESAILIGCNLADKTVDTVVLDGTDLSSTNCFNTSFVACSMRRAQFTHTTLTRATFRQVDLTGATFEEAAISQTVFDTTLNAVLFTNAHVDSAVLDSASVQCGMLSMGERVIYEDGGGLLCSKCRKPVDSHEESVVPAISAKVSGIVHTFSKLFSRNS